MPKKILKAAGNGSCEAEFTKLFKKLDQKNDRVSIQTVANLANCQLAVEELLEHPQLGPLIVRPEGAAGKADLSGILAAAKKYGIVPEDDGGEMAKELAEGMCIVWPPPL